MRRETRGVVGHVGDVGYWLSAPTGPRCLRPTLPPARLRTPYFTYRNPSTPGQAFSKWWVGVGGSYGYGWPIPYIPYFPYRVAHTPWMEAPVTQRRAGLGAMP